MSSEILTNFLFIQKYIFITRMLFGFSNTTDSFYVLGIFSCTLYAFKNVFEDSNSLLNRAAISGITGESSWTSHSGSQWTADCGSFSTVCWTDNTVTRRSSITVTAGPSSEQFTNCHSSM